MMDSGHAQLDLNNFSKYEKFYLWKIEESSEEETQFESLHEKMDDENEEFEHMKK